MLAGLPIDCRPVPIIRVFCNEWVIEPFLTDEIPRSMIGFREGKMAEACANRIREKTTSTR